MAGRAQGGYTGHSWDQGAPDDPTTGVKFDADGRRIKSVTCTALDYVGLQQTYGIVPPELQALQDDLRANQEDPKRWVNFAHVLFCRSQEKWSMPMLYLAAESYEKALELEWNKYKAAKDKTHMMNMAYIHHQLATILTEVGDTEKAKVHWEKSAGALGTAGGAGEGNTDEPPALED